MKDDAMNLRNEEKDEDSGDNFGGNNDHFDSDRDGSGVLSVNNSEEEEKYSEKKEGKKEKKRKRKKKGVSEMANLLIE
jgi:hypothetical protein